MLIETIDSIPALPFCLPDPNRTKKPIRSTSPPTALHRARRARPPLKRAFRPGSSFQSAAHFCEPNCARQETWGKCTHPVAEGTGRNEANGSLLEAGVRPDFWCDTETQIVRVSNRRLSCFTRLADKHTSPGASGFTDRTDIEVGHRSKRIADEATDGNQVRVPPVFYSEDMQDGQAIDGLTIRNPFSR